MGCSKWCGIALATIISVKIIVNIGYWGFHKLLESRKRRLEERRRSEERKRRAAYLSELHTKLAAEAAAIEDARVRQAREDQAIKDKLKRDEEESQTKARADYVKWEKECDIVFRNKALMTKFPFPPVDY